MEKEISIAKIVATATQNSWSQAYNAGKLFAVISLESETPVEENYLNLLGKEILDNLEAEYFALETKDLEGIKGAVKSSLSLVLENIKCSFVVGTIINNVLYAFAKKGTIEIKRRGKLGKILTGGDELDSASGFLEDKDIIILETSQFANIIPQDVLLLAIDDQPIDQISESLAPIVHEKADPAATAIVVQYKEDLPAEALAQAGEVPIEPVTPAEQNYAIPTEITKRIPSVGFLKKYLDFAKNKIQNTKLAPTFDRSRRTVLTVASILLLVLIITVFLAVKKQNDQKTAVLLAQYYAPASEKYDEGQSLLGLNQALARDSFYFAQKLLTEGENKLDRGSSGRKQIDELLNKVNSALAQTANIKTVTPVAVNSSESKLLSSELSASVQFAAKQDNDIYTLSANGVSKNGKVIVEKDWGTAGGLGIYFGNVYVLDKTAKQIFKFVSTASDFVKTNYFTKDTNPDVSTAEGIAIDGSIWVLLKDGTVLKFTRGASDNLSLTGLDIALVSPTRIFTNADSENIYILDNGNSRIVVFDKKGAYKAQYQADILKTAKDLEVNEKSKKLFILSSGKIYSIDLQ